MQEVFNFFKRLTKNSEGNLSVLGKIIKIVIIFFLVKFGIKIFSLLIDKYLDKRKKLKIGLNEKRIDTLAGILKNICKYIFYFIGIVIALDLFGIKTTSILATAGIGGLAIGFAAQGLIKDILTGFFILFENQFSVGDYVQIGECEGIVEEMGLRVTKLRNFSGELHIIPNSSIQTITNKTNGAMRALVDIGIAYEEDIDKSIHVLEAICREMKFSDKSIIEGPTVLGVTNLGAYDVVLTIIAKTKPMEQWRVERELRKKIKETFDKEGIEIPYPKKVIIEKQD